jgi:hypothetical protein
MKNSPAYKVKIVSGIAIRKLFTEHKFGDRLTKCVETCAEETPPTHAKYCCSVRMCRYVDTTIKEEIAVIAHVTYANERKKPKSEITKLLIGAVIFRHYFSQH